MHVLVRYIVAHHSSPCICTAWHQGVQQACDRFAAAEARPVGCRVVTQYLTWGVLVQRELLGSPPKPFQLCQPGSRQAGLADSRSVQCKLAGRANISGLTSGAVCMAIELKVTGGASSSLQAQYPWSTCVPPSTVLPVFLARYA